ncbi:MAG: CCA tRNA nucleotidyltransferase, partial [Candidatus Bilamarchaeaceae archaeon]
PILARISPSKKEEAETKFFAEKALSSLKRQLPKEVKMMLAGSVAKGTFLSGAGDIDLFAIFPHEYAKEDMFEEVKKASKKTFPKAKFEERFAEHPYLSIHFKGKKLDIVPSYEMKFGEKVKSAVDRSQLHTEFVLKNLPENKRGDARLLKQFLKANLLYGAEIKTRGFSGYLCELMIIHYKSFERFIQAVSRWQFPVFLDPAGHYGDPAEIPEFNSPLVVIDPVDRSRNVAAIIPLENLVRLQAIAREFTRRPSEAHFFPSKKSKKELSAHAEGREFFGISFRKPEGVVDDVFWGQFWRFASQVSAFLKHNGFEASGVYPYSAGKDCIVLLELKSSKLPKTQVFRGPPQEHKKHVTAFKKSHMGPYFIEGGRVCAKGKRRLWNISLAFRDLKKRKDFPSHIQPSLFRSRLLGKKEIISKFPEALDEYFRVRCFSE